MLAKASKCTTEIIHYAANFAYKHEQFLNENLPLCKSPAEVAKAFASSDSWFVLADGQPIAVFKFEITGRTGTASQICTADTASLDAIVTGLRRELDQMSISSFTLRVPSTASGSWIAAGFERKATYVRFARTPTVSNMMPILPLINATQRELPILSDLMFAAYAKTPFGFPDTQSAETALRAIMSGVRGRYLATASFASGTAPNLVSACLLTLDSPGAAKIEQVFTHPLYRARGLATSEIAEAMNRLATSGVNSLFAWNREGDEVLRRLLTKMSFKLDQTVVEMTLPA